MTKNRQEYLDTHPLVNEFHFTKDGLAFANKDVAEAHQKAITGKVGGVETVKRSESDKVDNSEEIEALKGKLTVAQEALLDVKDAKGRAELEATIEGVKAELDKLQ